METGGFLNKGCSLMAANKAQREAFEFAEERLLRDIERCIRLNLEAALPPKGARSKASLRRRWGRWLYQYRLPLALRKAMLKASVGLLGAPTPDGDELRRWMLVNLYSNSTTLMYNDWLRCRNLP